MIQPSRQRALRILIIEDQPEFSELLSHHLSSRWSDAHIEHIDVEAAGATLEVDLDSGVDLVLLDYNLGRFNGLELLRELKQSPRCPPIIFLTGEGDDLLAVAAIRAGADDYIAKGELTHRLLINACIDALYRRGGGRATSTPPLALTTLAEALDVGDYEVTARLASGPASVYLAADRRTGSTVALKVLELAHAAAHSDLLDRFNREYQAISALRHPHVARIMEHGVTERHAFIAMEYFARGDLRARLRLGPLTVAEGLRCARQIAMALECMHDAGVLHRDLKPANVMLRDDDSAALIDFGLAKELRRGSVQHEGIGVSGTPYYMSPEQAGGDSIDARSDLYSLGIILFEMLTGLKPFTAVSAQAVMYKHRHAPRPQLPSTLAFYQPLIDRLLAVGRGDRVSSAAEAVAMLNAAG